MGQGRPSCSQSNICFSLSLSSRHDKRRRDTGSPKRNWDKKTAEGTTVTVPPKRRGILFVAPETGGDFNTLRSAVKAGRVLFIRADADLNEASFEQQRIERYLTAMKTVPQNDEKTIQDFRELASALALKPNADCFKKPVEQQVNCLTQSSAPVSSRRHGQSIAEPSRPAHRLTSSTLLPIHSRCAGLYSAYVALLWISSILSA